MATSRNSERIRFRYGICLSENCSKCKSREVQEISARKELVCAECGKPLRECPPPKKSSNKPLIIGIVVAVAVIACGVGAYFLLFRSAPEEEVAEEEAVEQMEETQPETLPADSLQTDSVAEDATPPEENEAASVPAASNQQQAPVQRTSSNSSNASSRNSGSTSQSGSVNLGYGTYQGEMSGGKPHGQGKLVYSRQTVISKYDPKARTAGAGEYVQGLFSNGYPTIVKHYDANGHLIETLNLGVD